MHYMATVVRQKEKVQDVVPRVINYERKIEKSKKIAL